MRALSGSPENVDTDDAMLFGSLANPEFPVASPDGNNVSTVGAMQPFAGLEWNSLECGKRHMLNPLITRR